MDHHPDVDVGGACGAGVAYDYDRDDDVVFDDDDSGDAAVDGDVDCDVFW